MKNKIFLLALITLIGFDAFSQNTTLDTSFGTNGKVVTDLGVSTEAILETAVDGGGRLIAVGYAASSPNSGLEVLHVVRYNLNGSLDTTFGINGVVRTSFGFPGSLPKYLGLLVASDGKILVAAGRYTGSVNNNDIAIIYKFNDDGSPDLSFGENGMVYSIPGFNYASAIAATSDGKFIIAGNSTFNGITGYDIIIARMDANGTIDTTFGSSGFTTIDDQPQDLPNAMKILSDGKIVFGITQFGFERYGQFVLAKLTSNGHIDTSFGTNGIVRTAFSSPGSLSDFIIGPENKIIACGTIAEDANISEIALAKYNENGSLDTSFGIGGKERYQNPNYAVIAANSLVMLADGKIITGGLALNPQGSDTRIKYNLMKFNANGSLDVTFGINGIIDMFGTQRSIVNKMQVYNNKLYVSGVKYSSYSMFAVARYNIDGSLSTEHIPTSQDLFKIFPIPFTDKITLISPLKYSEEAAVFLYDGNGRKLQQLTQGPISPGESLILDMDETLSTGIYFLQVTDGMSSTTLKIIK